MPLIPLSRTVGDLFPHLIPPSPQSTFAIWPVWRDSTTKQVKFQPLSKKQAVRLWHDARRFERQTREKGKQDGALGRNGLAVLHALLFDFLNYASGALYPSQAAIAEAACICERSVTRGLEALKRSGVVNWLRRAVEDCQAGGGFILRQISNAYAVLPCSQWRGYVPPPPAPPPARGTWGDHPPIPGMIDQAVEAGRKGASLAERVALLRSDPTDGLALALAGLGAGIDGAKA